MLYICNPYAGTGFKVKLLPRNNVFRLRRKSNKPGWHVIADVQLSSHLLPRIQHICVENSSYDVTNHQRVRILRNTSRVAIAVLGPSVYEHGLWSVWVRTVNGREGQGYLKVTIRGELIPLASFRLSTSSTAFAFASFLSDSFLEYHL